MVSAMKQHQNQAYLLAHHINKDRLFGRRDFPLAIPGCSAQALGGGTFSVSQLRAGGPPKSVILSKATQLRVIPSQETTVPSITVDPVQTQPQTSVQDTGKSKLVPPQVVSADCSSQASRELKVFEQGEKKSISDDQGSLSPKKERLSPKPAVKGDVKGKAPKTPSPESTSKALPILLPVDGANSTNSHPGSQENQTVSSKTSKPSSSKDLLSDDDLFCTCPIQPKPSVPLRAKDPQAHKVVVFHSSSPTDDERLRAKAKSLQLASSKDSTTQGPEHSQTKSTLLAPPKCSPLPPKKTGHKEIPEIKTENSQNKVSNETQKVTKTVPVLVETSKATSYADKAATIPAMDCKKQGNNKAKTQRSAPFLSFRNLLSATFPARLRRETDERQAQLQKVRQYELEFLEELLKPKAAQAEFLPQGPSLVPVGTSCACQLRSSPVQKVPGVSREQRRSCDCKRLCRGIRLPDTPVGSALERRGRERTVSKTPPTIHKTSPEGPKKASQLEGVKRPQTLEIKTTRIRSTSLESREPQGKPVSCLPTCTSHSECIAAPHYMKLQRRYSIGEADSNECAPLYAEVKKVKSKSLEKEMERVRATGLRLPTPVEPSYTHAGDGKRKGVFSIQEEELLKEDRVEANEVVLGLPSEDNDDRQKCCSFCFCYRKCDTTDENSEKDELSYSIPLQVLPGMQLDSHAMPVVSKTLQVLDAEDCSGAVEVEDPQSHEIDLRACGSLEASLSRVKALQGKTFSLPDGFLTAQLDANELLALLRQCASSPQAEDELRLQAPQLAEYKQELALRFKEFRASCRRVAGVEKSPTRMLSAVTASFQVLCSLTQSFIQLVRGVRSETQRLQLLRKVEEVAVNYTLLLRAAEESMGHSSSLPTKSSSPLPGNPAANMGSLNRPINSLSTK